MDVHLDGEAEEASGIPRNGSSEETVLPEDGARTLSIPRDRHGRYDPALVAKYKRRFQGFDEKIIPLYARGMSTRDIQKDVGALYDISTSPDLVSAVKMPCSTRFRPDRTVRSRGRARSCYSTQCGARFVTRVSSAKSRLGAHPDREGHKEVFGLWIEEPRIAVVDGTSQTQFRRCSRTR